MYKFFVHFNDNFAMHHTRYDLPKTVRTAAIRSPLSPRAEYQNAATHKLWCRMITHVYVTNAVIDLRLLLSRYVNEDQSSPASECVALSCPRLSLCRDTRCAWSLQVNRHTLFLQVPQSSPVVDKVLEPADAGLQMLVEVGDWLRIAGK
jgi:hypothetical protein